MSSAFFWGFAPIFAVFKNVSGATKVAQTAHLQHRVGLQQAVFDRLHLLTGWTGDGVVLQDLLGRLSLPSAALPRDEDALVLSLCSQGTVRVVRHCVAGGAQEEM